MSENKKCVSCEFKKEVTFSGGTFFNFDVKFEGDDKVYQYSAKDKNNPAFKVGETSLVDIEVKTGQGQDGTEWKIYKVRPAKVNPQGGGGRAYVKKTKGELLVESLSFVESYVKDMVVAGKIEYKDWGKTVDNLMSYNEKKIAEYMKPE